MSLTGIEKRKHARIPLTYVTVDVISIMGELKKSETSEIIDLSESGMRFSGNTSYPSGFKLRVTFILPGTAIPIRTSAEVVHQLKMNNGYHTGVSFKGITLAEFAILKTYIEKNLSFN